MSGPPDVRGVETERTDVNWNVLVVCLAVVTALTALAAALSFTLSAPVPAPVQPRAFVDADDVAGVGEELDGDEIGLAGFAGRPIDTTKPKLTAFFERESYEPGTVARLFVTDRAEAMSVQIFRAGDEDRRTIPSDVMLGTPVGDPAWVGSVRGRRTVALRIGAWESGVYFARLTSGRRVGYATFVLRPRRLGEHRIAVVMPTQTWQAYNFRDDDGDGYGDTWYAWRSHQALLIRPFLDRGVPPHWKDYDAPFVHWLAATGRKVDYLSDAELRAVPNGRVLAQAYTLIVFSGHHEYVTSHEYDVVTQYRDLGGNLAFLSANNFFWKIKLDGAVMTRVAEWRDLGRPEASLIGVQYRGNDAGTHRGSWIVCDVPAARWLLADTEIGPGDGFGSGGIEIDHRAPSSPAGLQVIGQIPDLFGPGFTAQMTYYETETGAKVFAAGAFSLASDAWSPTTSQLLQNLWTQLAVD